MSSPEKPPAAASSSASGGTITRPSTSPPSPGKSRKKRDSHALRKAPQAPKRFKSSYICFFMAKQPEIKAALGDSASITEVSKRSAELWRNLSAEEKIYWDDVAAKDKQRYLAEKATYTGPWQVPYKRARKDPSAPKRPMSAFLYFSQERRKFIKEKNPGLRNTEISRELGKEWRKASEEERRPHIERERAEREKYKVEIAKWKAEQEEKEAELKKQREEQQRLFAEEAAKNPPPPPQEPAASAAGPAPYPGYASHGGWQPPPYMYFPPPAQQGDDAPPYPPPSIYAYPPPPPGTQTSPTGMPTPQVLGPSGMPQHTPPGPYYPYPYAPHPVAPPPPGFDPNVAPDPFDPEQNQFQEGGGDKKVGDTT